MEASIDAATLETVIGQLVEDVVHVYVPKFELTRPTIVLNDALTAMGMADAFDPLEPGQADFSGMVDTDELVRRELQPPMIAFALHKAFINVDEQGAEAAATGIGATPVGASSYLPIEVRVDRPCSPSATPSPARSCSSAG